MRIFTSQLRELLGVPVIRTPRAKVRVPSASFCFLYVQLEVLNCFE